ncbi:MAG: molybdopterin molybdotransferase MoeA [Clostridiaceae bacterium]|nr:molybdopterin molybdotransferase MoeA [Clostridiaceae bacterium]
MMLNVSTIEDALARLEQSINQYGTRYGNLTNALRAVVSDRVETAAGLINRAIRPADYEKIEIYHAAGRILAEDILAPLDVPGFDRSTVDGYAVSAADTFGASQSLPAVLRLDGSINMGKPAGSPLAGGFCREISTGGALPEGADAVIMIEDTEPASQEDELRFLLRPVSPGQNVIFRGDDIMAGTCLLTSGTTLKPHHVGALAAIGRTTVTVLRKLKIALISTGDELVQPGHELSDGQIYDVNNDMLAAMLKRANTEISCIGIIADELDDLKQTISQAGKAHDLVIISGGSSAGERDHAAAAINQLGLPGVIQHGLAVKPGKPTLIGLADQLPIIGLPGHPVAAWFMADQIIDPLIELLSGRKPRIRKTIVAVLARAVPANHGRQSFIAVSLRDQSGSLLPIAVPAASKSGLITTLRSTDGYIIIDRDQEGLSRDSEVTVYLWEDI